MPRKSKLTRFRRAAVGYMFASPWLVGFSLFTVYAVIMVIYYSFTDFGLFAPPYWIGTENFSELFFYDPLFKTSLYNTFYYVAFAVPLGIIVAFFLVLILNQPVRGVTIFRTVFYLPAIVPAVASSILWLWILHPDFGLLNYVLYLYQNAFTYLKMGYASAQALVLFGIILFFTMIIVLTSKKWVYYAAEK